MKSKILSGDGMGRNNLDKSSSPYLLQHVSNPVWWQEWNAGVLGYAASHNMPIMVSVGYATCHWCHVMASEAFSDSGTADYLNEHFICIKVDREQRPDIDHFMMDFINGQQGRGGWPLNVFLTPALRPVYAITYAPAQSSDRGDSFLSIAEKVFAFIEKNGSEIPFFSPEEASPPVAEADAIPESLFEYFDREHGGFGSGQKFPSHSTLLFLLYSLAAEGRADIKVMCNKTLDAMRLRGLNDHLQGGIFRYCVDNAWTIPHFEKMLYDQAMALWTYSLAYRVLGREEYRWMAEKIIKCLDESFENNGFYISAHDADTEHSEGATYLWSYEQLAKELTSDEFSRFTGSYYITRQGNFEGKNHLLRLNDVSLEDIEGKLLAHRKKRKQPLRDEKILCGTNALLCIAFTQASRLLNEPEYQKKAVSLLKKIVGLFWDRKTLGHSYSLGVLQKQDFLSDAAALLAALSMQFEDDPSWEKPMKEVATYVESFKEGDRWIEAHADDFQAVSAGWFDHPIPSGISMAEFGLARFDIITGRNAVMKEYRQPFQSDFYNIGAMISNNLFHVITSPETVHWIKMPVNSIFVRGPVLQDCYKGTCTIPSPEAL